jgi:(1->4)-alpha-D-glucan 1-alpha-D-glucosylmutase
MRVPGATYRLQFNRHFRFADARRLVPYLAALGVTDLYASPLFQARAGSTHGYDVTDPTRLNPELGSREEFEGLVSELQRAGMGVLLDIVPNHMAASPENPGWVDVLENGPSSRYARTFDIDWSPAPGAAEGRVLLPVLGGPYGSVLENQELTLGLDEGGLHVRYFDVRLPLDPKSYRAVLAHRIRSLEQRLGATHPAFRALIDLVDATRLLPAGFARHQGRIEQRHREKEGIKQKLWQLYLAHPEIKAYLEENLRIFNGGKGDPQSFDLLDQLLGGQAYRLGYWRVARAQMNYRRFFDINDLVSVRVEDPRVLEATHTLILEWAAAGKVTGLRVDHIDGLYDPVGYLEYLQRRVAGTEKARGSPPGFYVLVEKILTGDETLPEEWPACGTTGYEFSRAVNGVFIDPRGIRRLDRAYADFTGAETTFAAVVYHRKRQVMDQLFPGEVRTLGETLCRLAGQDRHGRDLPPRLLVQALVEVTACLPVYRTYIRDFEVPARDRAVIARAVEEAERRNDALGAPVLPWVRRVLLLEFPAPLAAEAKEAWLRFVRRWQQFTGPIMAKGLEDTALYVYNRLVSLNEVGGDPEAQRSSVKAFHRHSTATRAQWPHTLNATSTHDTKRSEDVRARINVLSELAETWAACVSRWSRWNRGKKRPCRGQPVPEPHAEVFLYQTLVGAWPLCKDELPALRERCQAYIVKAAKEAKGHTSWIDPDPEYEKALAGFVEAILTPSSRNAFLPDFVKFQKKIAFYGACNALAQVLLKIGAPGVPDFYQGTELWDFSLVDPDNRRPVDFPVRTRLLAELDRRENTDRARRVADLLSRWDDGRLKLYVTATALRFRRGQRELFLDGEYLPLSASGRRRAHVCAFARRKGAAWAVVAVPRLLAQLVRTGVFPCGGRVWGRDRLILPREAPRFWGNVLTGETVEGALAAGRRVLPLTRVFAHFPVALLSGGPTEARE